MRHKLQRFRRRVDRGLLVLALITLAVVAFLAFLNWRRFENAVSSSARSRAVLDANGSLLTAVKDAEAAMRMFILTGEVRDLEPYQAIVQTIPARKKKLLEVAVQPYQSNLASRIVELTDKRLGFLSIGLQIRYRRGLEAATEYVQTGGGREEMEELRGLSAQLFIDEYDEQAREAKIAERRAFDTFLVALVGCTLTFLILLLMKRAVDGAIAQRNSAIQELAGTSQRLEITLASIGDGVIATDREGRVTFLNKMAETLTGWAHDEATDRPAAEVFRIADESTGNPLSNPLQSVLEGRIQTTAPRHLLLLPKVGEPIAIADSGSPIRTADGQMVGAVLVFRDIRESRDAQRQIEKWHRLFRAGGFGMAVIDSEDNTLRDLNPAFAAMHGYEESELLGKNFSTLLAAIDEPHLRSLQEKGQVTFESLHRHKNGRIFPVLTDMTTFRDAAGRATERAAYFSDISARILAERISRHTQERFKTAVEVVGDIIWTNNAEGQMDSEQTAWSNFTGQTFDEYRGYGWSTALHPDDLERTLAEWNLAVAEKRKFVTEHRLRRHDGVYRLFSVRALPLFDDQNDVREWVGVHADITEEREQREQLTESEARFRGLATSLPQVIWSTRPDGEFEYTNPAWNEYLAVDPLQPGLWENILHPEDTETILPQWREALAAGRAFEFQARLKRASDGTFRCFLCRSLPLLNEQGKVIRWFGSCTDIDDQSQRAAELRSSNEALSRSNADLEQFAYAASHDLQEPLRMVALYTQLLGEEYADRLDETARSYIDQSLRASHRMETLLQALLAYSTVSAPALQDNLADGNEAAQDAVANLESLIGRTGATVHCSELPKVRIASVRLTQVLQNLIGNSLKYRREDVPAIVEVSARRQGASLWRFAIKDNGIGMESQYLEQIFGIFKRLHGQDYEGTGIGLAICQRIVENHGGKIWVESAVGQGTTFFFTLPAA